MYPHNMQDVSSDCGVSVLKSLLQYYRRYFDIDFMNCISQKEFHQGLSLTDISDVLGEYHIYGSCYEVYDIKKIAFNFPVVIITQEDIGNHYLLIYEERNGILTVSDPSLAEIIFIEKTELFKKFVGYAYIIERIGSGKKIKKKTIYQSTASHKEKLDILLVATLQFIIPLFILFSLQYLILYRVGYIDYQELIFIILFYVLLICIQIISKHIDKSESLVIEYRGKQQEINRFMQKVDNIQNRREHNLYNEIITFWMNFNASNRDLLLYEVKIEIIYLLLFLILLSFFSVRIFIFVLMFTMLLLGLIIPKIYNIRNYNKVFMNKMGKISNFVEEYMKNKIDRYIFSDRETVNNYIRELLEDLQKHKQKQQQKENNILYIYDTIMYVILLAIFCYMTISVIDQLPLRFDDLMICFIIVYLLFNSLKPTTLKAIEITKYNSIKRDIVAEANYFYETHVENKHITSDNQISSISLIDLTFSYDKKVNLLCGIHAEMAQGQLFLIDGDNGSGKTTLLNLILGLEKGYHGKIAFRNHEYMEIYSNANVIRKNFSYYSHDQYLNYATTRNNVVYNIYNYKDSSKVKNFFDLNLDKVIFYNGENISLGEKQKILLLRCLNKESQVYIFDEPTTNLDSASKQQLIEIFLDLKKRQKLVIVVTHDSELKKLADSVLYLNKNEGEIKDE